MSKNQFYSSFSYYEFLYCQAVHAGDRFIAFQVVLLRRREYTCDQKHFGEGSTLKYQNVKNMNLLDKVNTTANHFF